MATAFPYESWTGESAESQLILKEMQAQFSKEVLNWFLKEAGFENICAKIPAYESYEFFTNHVFRTTVILGYIFRPVFRKLFRSQRCQASDAAGFENVVMSYQVKRINNLYMLSFLVWVCYVVDFTIFCLVDHVDHVEVALRCLSNSDVQYFQTQGGWTELHKLCAEYAKAYNVVGIIINVEDPTQNALLPFFSVVQYITSEAEDNPDEEWLLYTTHLRLIRKIYKDLMKEYSIDSILDPSGVMGGYSVRQKNSPKCSPQKPLLSPQKTLSLKTSPQRFLKVPSPQSSVTFSPRRSLLKCYSEVNQQLFSDTKIPSTSNACLLTKLSKFVEIALENLSMDNNENTERSETFLEIDESKSNYMFIMTDRFLGERKASLDKIVANTPKPLSPPETTEKGKKPTVNDIVNKNIIAGNYVDLGCGLHVIYPDRYNIDDKNCVNYYLDREEKDASSFRDVPVKIQKLCRTIFELRVKQEEIAGASKRVSDEQRMQIEHSEPEREIPADVKRRIEMMIKGQKTILFEMSLLGSSITPKESIPPIYESFPKKKKNYLMRSLSPDKYEIPRPLEIPETCPSVETTQLQNYTENPKDLSSVQAASDASSSKVQTSNEQKQGESSQKRTRRRRNKSKK